MTSLAHHGKQLAKKSLRLLPESLCLKVIKRYVSSKTETIRGKKYPDALTFFITNRCNARCQHCFYWKEINTRQNELSLEEIEKIASSISNGVDSLALTGGEPSLRRDLKEICQIFNQRSQTRYIGIATNGLLPEIIRNDCEWILKNCQLEKLNVQISLDGIGEVHDKIRRVPNAFARAMETIKLLCELRKNTNLSINTALAIQPGNQHEIKDFIRHLTPLNVEMKFLVIRGNSYGTYGLSPQISSEINPASEESASVSLNAKQLEEVYFELMKLNEESQREFWSELEQAKMFTTLSILEKKRRIIPCYAGILEGVIYPDGGVAICELTKPFGNLRDFNYDFNLLWKSNEANIMRSQTQKCACIHDCNLTTGLRFEPEILYSTIMKRSLKNRAQRWRCMTSDK